MSTSQPTEPTNESASICQCKDELRPMCEGKATYKTEDGSSYCVFHFPGKEKRAAFKLVLEKKLLAQDFNFRGAWFPDELIFGPRVISADADFSEATFSAAADFSEVEFQANSMFVGANFKGDAKFGKTIFSAAFFSRARFDSQLSFAGASFGANATFINATLYADANFSNAKFAGRADFTEVAFRANVTFRSAEFIGDADFSEVTFAGYADFRHAKFNVGLASQGTRSLNLQFAKIEKTDHLSFHTLELHPHWFVDVDARKIDFSYVGWENRGKVKKEIRLLEQGDPDKILGVFPLIRAAWKERGAIGLDGRRKTFGELLKTNWWNRQQQKEALQFSKKEGIASLRLLDITCRKLAANAEENARYPEASHFRRMAMDAERLEKWHGFAFWRLGWWYWLTSGYGERPFRAFIMLVAIWALSALAYTKVPPTSWETKAGGATGIASVNQSWLERFPSALAYSAGVILFQKPEPRPVSTPAQALVLGETVFGPLQAALLALAIRRKFMR